MSLQCGLVGLPNVGKSTLFNALTKMGIQAENYPFCTIEPNVGLVTVPDPRLEQLASIDKPLKIVPAFMEFVDVAGLVEGASQGQGLGNQFLGHIRTTDAICHVIRCFDDPDITHVLGTVDPVRDAKIIENELILADLQSLERSIEKLKKMAKSGGKELQEELEKSLSLQAHLEEGKPARSHPEVSFFPSMITAKPLLYVANVKEDDLTEENDWVKQLRSYATQHQSDVLVLNAALEAELAILDDKDRQEFLEAIHLDSPILHRLIRHCYKLLHLSTFFTSGEKEVHAWTIPLGALAPVAAGKIHSDFEKGFIRAEVIAFEDYLQYKGVVGAKNAGKWRLEGKTYSVQDGDVIVFLFNKTT